MPTWRCRPYQPGDETRLAALFQTVFDRPMTPAHWVWKLGQGANGVPNVWLAVDDAGHPVCHYAGIPRGVHLEGRDHRVMVIVDAMTHPACRRQGLLTEVVRQAHAAWRSAGVSFLLGMPNEAWGSRRGELGWQPIADLRWFVTPLHPEAVLARRFGWAALSKVTLLSDLWSAWWDGRSQPGFGGSEVTGAAAEAVLRELPAQPVAAGDATLDRDAEWVTRRLLERPESPYRVLVAKDAQAVRSYIAYQTLHLAGRRVGTVTDVVRGTADASVARWLLREALGRLRAEGADIAMALAVPGTPDDALLRRAGFLFTQGTFSVDAVMLDQRLPIETLRGARWRLGGSDFDLI